MANTELSSASQLEHINFVPPMINAAIIGCGEMGRLHADCIARLTGIRVYACCDTDESRALAFREKYGAIFATAQPERIWQDANIDLSTSPLQQTATKRCASPRLNMASLS